MGHQDNGLCAIVDGVSDCGEGTNNALVVCDGGAVQGDVEVDLYNHSSEQSESSLFPAKVCEYPNQDALVLEVDVGDG